MHTLQKVLLKRLKQQNKLRYADLTRGYDFEDNIVFHLRQLINLGLIFKAEKFYSLTINGMQEAAKLEGEIPEVVAVKTFFIGYVCDDGQENYLVKSHPSAKPNFYNLPNVKPHFGEEINDALIRGFAANTGLEILAERFNYLNLHLKTIVTTTGEVLFDDAMAMYQVTVTAEEKEQMKLMENVEWVSKNEISALSNKWPEIDLCIVEEPMTGCLAYQIDSNYTL